MNANTTTTNTKPTIVTYSAKKALHSADLAKYQKPDAWFTATDGLKHLYLRVVHQWAGFELRRIIGHNKKVEERAHDPNAAARSRYMQVLKKTEFRADQTLETEDWSRLLTLSAIAIVAETQKSEANEWLGDSLLPIEILTKEFAEFTSDNLAIREREQAAKFGVAPNDPSVLARIEQHRRAAYEAAVPLFAGVTRECEMFQQDAIENLDSLLDELTEAISECGQDKAAERTLDASVRAYETGRQKYLAGGRAYINPEVSALALLVIKNGTEQPQSAQQ